MTDSHVKRLGDGAAVVSYIRLQQQQNSETGKTVVVSSSETRVWQKTKDELWRCVHFHLIDRKEYEEATFVQNWLEFL
jgi:ketosteroid isomerase-like protein